jgi:hypothetical protein
MALETPNQVIAAAVVFVQDAMANATFEFRSVSGFESCRLANPADPNGGYLLTLSNPCTNDEGLPQVAGDLDSDMNNADTWITPMHLETGLPGIDDADPYQMAVFGFLPLADSFRFYAQVVKIQTGIDPIPNEPLTP